MNINLIDWIRTENEDMQESQNQSTVNIPRKMVK